MKKLVFSLSLMFCAVVMFGQSAVSDANKAEMKKEEKTMQCAAKKTSCSADKAKCTPGSCIGAEVKEMEGKVVLATVKENSPAAKAGLQEGDAIVSASGRNISSESELVEVMMKHEATKSGEPISFQIERGGETMEKNVSTAKVEMKSCSKSGSKKGCCASKKKKS